MEFLRFVGCSLAAAIQKLIPAGAALAGVSMLCYGLSWLVDLVQRWAGVTAHASSLLR